MTYTEELVCRTALNNMLKGSHFSICTIDSILKIINVHPNRNAYDMLHALHCVHYKDMPVELRKILPNLIRECLCLEPTFEFNTLHKEVIEVNSGGFFRKLVSGKI
jgi:hypothetical protein